MTELPVTLNASDPDNRIRQVKLGLGGIIATVAGADGKLHVATAVHGGPLPREGCRCVRDGIARCEGTVAARALLDLYGYGSGKVKRTSPDRLPADFRRKREPVRVSASAPILNKRKRTRRT